MIPRTVRAATALSALALVTSAAALDFNKPAGELREQCNMSSIYGDYQPPKNLAQAPTEIIKGESADARLAKKQELHDWLTANRVPLKSTAFSIQLSEGELAEIGAGDSGAYQLQMDQRRVKVGVDKALGFDVSFHDINAKSIGQQPEPHMGGALSRGLQGELVWSAVARSEGAKALRIGFEEVNLPDGAELYVYNEQGQAFGPYTKRGPNGSGTFWSNTIMGSELTLQLHYFGPESDDGLLNLGFKVNSLTHIGPKFPVADFLDPDQFGDKVHCSYNDTCVEPASSSGSAPVDEAKDAVALMIYSSRGGAYICSGGLLADTDSNSVIPYFLTANHCISKGNEASSLETFFDFEGDCSDQYAQNGSYPGTNGSTILSTNRTSDYTLLQLASNPSGTRAYLGWNNNPIAFSDGADLYRISHPSGAPQAYSHHAVDTSKGTCQSWPRGNWIYSTDLFGATEGGSSGSPVLNSAGQVVGQLSGGCGTNVNDVCDTQANATVDGALAAYWGDVQQYLDPTDGGGDPPPSGDATVDSVTVSVEQRGPWYRANATVRIVDGSGSPVANASVSGSFNGDATGSGSGTTDSNGIVTFTSDKTRDPITNAGFCVDTVNGSAASGNTCS